MINIKSEKGITLVALISTVIVLLILAGVTVTSIDTTNGAARYNNMIADIDLLNDKSHIYYAEYGEIPKTERTINIDGMDYYEIDINKFDNITLNYGADYNKSESLESTSDVYLINSNLDVYYLKGVEDKKEVYHTKN